MLRIRFHGRGGHGVKTASRILGTAAFLAGWEAQDSPVYGAERRGAAVTAYTRCDHAPIRERGVITAPDLVLVADETLLGDPAAAVLAGQQGVSLLFVNSPRDARDLAERHGVACPVLTRDLTSLAAATLGRASALSAPLGAAACRLADVATEETVLRAVREELLELHLGTPAIERNVELARRVFADLEPAARSGRRRESPSTPMHPPTYVGVAAGAPMIRTVGNSAARHTGTWRIARPVIDRDICSRCSLCIARCPDAAMTFDAEGYPVIDYSNCKGCMLCAQECPLHCIHEEKEVQAW